jgi:hypothetical protein
MSDSEASAMNKSTDNQALSNNMADPEPKVAIWEGQGKGAGFEGAELGAALNDLAEGGSVNDLDLDHLNDNLQDCFDDNLSLEVNFGDGSSCRASDVSSLSFQNIALDDADNSESDPNMDIVFRRRGSISESSDSPLYDFACDENDEAEGFSGRLEEELRRREPSADNLHPDSPDECDYDSDSTNTGTMKRRNKLAFCSSASDLPTTNLPTPPSNSYCTPTGDYCDGGGCCSPPTNHFDHMANNNRYLPQFQEKPPAVELEANASKPDVIQSRSGSSDKDIPAKNSFDTPSDAGDTTPTVSETLHSNSSNGNQSDTSMDTAASSTSTQKRNSLEIRNNIPDLRETKNCNSDYIDDRPKLQAMGAVPKIRKKSPGLARRLADSMQIQDQDSSSSERESEPAQIDTTVRSAQKDFEAQLQDVTDSVIAQRNKEAICDTAKPTNGISSDGKSNSFEKLCDSLLGNDSIGNVPNPGSSDTSPDDVDRPEGLTLGMEIENEYDYIKYARIQHGDSYVGMRLAYSSSNDSLNVKRSWSGGVRASDEEYLGSSRENSPEKLSIRQPRLADQIHMSKVNEDTLTEIPLNGSDYIGSEEKNFSLSPEATECDSAEVESVISEEGKSSTSGMPMVEDGLSSSQGSDTEDTSMHDVQDQTPSEILKRRYKAEIDQELQSSDVMDALPQDDPKSMSITDNSSSIHSTPSHASGTSGTGSIGHHKNKEVDMAIEDIKSAIERSKKAAEQKAAQQNNSAPNHDPVWVMR